MTANEFLAHIDECQECGWFDGGFHFCKTAADMCKELAKDTRESPCLKWERVDEHWR